ncbi:MAG: 4Fe-4S dicluster-binding protein, partial [Oscillospiraceae bacterium]
RGKALPNIFKHNDLSRDYKLFSGPNPEKCIGCGRCVAACNDSAYSAIHLDENRIAIVDKEKCDGCGLCSQVCPVADCIEMKRK